VRFYTAVEAKFPFTNEFSLCAAFFRVDTQIWSLCLFVTMEAQQLVWDVFFHIYCNENWTHRYDTGFNPWDISTRLYWQSNFYGEREAKTCLFKRT